jgi:hypothetical protein
MQNESVTGEVAPRPRRRVSVLAANPARPWVQYIRSGPVGARGVFGKWGFSSKIVCLL